MAPARTKRIPVWSGWLAALFVSVLSSPLSNAWTSSSPPAPPGGRFSGLAPRPCGGHWKTTTRFFLSDWSDFTALDDDYDKDDGDGMIDIRTYAEENDSQEYKAQVGATLEAPAIDDEYNVEPILVPQGSVLELSVDNVLGVLSACRDEIGTLFGYTAENRGVGITGGVDYVELDGPIVVLSLKGRFWHQRTTVLDRVKAYLMGRIPEIIDVVVEDEWQLTDEANEVF